MEVGGVDLNVRASINHCSTPIDVTFLIQNSLESNEEGLHEEGSFGVVPDYVADEPKPQSERREISWKYTFVTTNQAETKEVPGLTNGLGPVAFCCTFWPTQRPNPSLKGRWEFKNLLI